MTDSTMTEIPLVERLERPLVIEHAVPTPVHEVLQRAADERGEAAAMLKAAVEALEALAGPPERDPELPPIYEPRWSALQCREIARNTLASLKQPGGR